VKYFKHDVGAQRDLKLRLVLREFGPEGVGIYWMLVEMLADERLLSINMKKMPVEMMADELRITAERLRTVLHYMLEINLFSKDSWENDVLYSPALETRVDEYTQRTIKKKGGSVPPQELPVVHEFIEYWNKSGMLGISKITPERRAKLLTRLKSEHFRDTWRTAVDRLSKSSWMNGRNEKGFRVSVEWFINNDTNYVKALEGKYDDRTKEDRFSKY